MPMAGPTGSVLALRLPRDRDHVGVPVVVAGRGGIRQGGDAQALLGVQRVRVPRRRAGERLPAAHPAAHRHLRPRDDLGEHEQGRPVHVDVAQAREHPRGRRARGSPARPRDHAVLRHPRAAAAHGPVVPGPEGAGRRHPGVDRRARPRLAEGGSRRRPADADVDGRPRPPGRGAAGAARRAIGAERAARQHRKRAPHRRRPPRTRP